MTRVPGSWMSKWPSGDQISNDCISNMMAASKAVDRFKARVLELEIKLRLCFNARPNHNPHFEAWKFRCHGAALQLAGASAMRLL